jgi:pimeloyl-ACP methyl ester carboxylesterase
VRAVSGPVIVYGHSSGGTVALEALATAPSLFAGGVIYEPALVVGGPDALHLAGDAIPRDGEVGEGLILARAALAAGKPGDALGIFISISAGWPKWVGLLAGKLTALFPAYRALIPCQIDDLETMERLGVRFAAYSQIRVPTMILGGERSPVLVREMVAALLQAMPSAQHETLRGQAHSGHVRDPKQVARAVEAYADEILRHP